MSEFFKRNQVEEAISHVSGVGSRKPSSELRAKLKRLLETDRNLGRRPRSTDPEQAHYAFFSGDAPGTGVEVWFSAYEAFALFTGWRLLEHGFPQASAVAFVRRARPELEKKHGEILAIDPAKIFDQRRGIEGLREGSEPHGTTHPLFLVLASHDGEPTKSGDRATAVRIFDEREVWHYMRQEPVGLSLTQFELVRAAHALQRALRKTTPSKRGRGSS
jgi:hypothetical protein